MSGIKLNSTLGSVTLSPEDVVGSGVVTVPNVTGTLAVATGISTTFTTVDGKTITVTDGVITGVA
jgi:hypothetical protein